MIEPPGHPFAHCAEGVAQAWVNFRINDTSAGDEAQAILAGAHSADASALRALSLAFESLRWVIARRADPACLAITDARLRSVRAQGFPRAVRLAEVAWAWARVYVPDHQPQALALLLMNLLSNATKFTSQEHVRVHLDWLHAQVPGEPTVRLLAHAWAWPCAGASSG